MAGAQSIRGPANRAGRQQDYSPLHWNDYFEEAHDVPVEQEQDAHTGEQQELPDSFRVYLRNFGKPCAPDRKPGEQLDPNRVELTREELHTMSQVPTLVLLHGGGYSALTWAPLAHYLQEHCHCRLLAIDLRGHGDTKSQHEERTQIGQLVRDVTAVVHQVHKLCGFPDTPRLVLVGHSMGGALAIKCAAADSLGPYLAGLVVIDVVEGTAKDALPLMMSVIKSRPSRFVSLENAIEWCVRSGMSKSVEAARVSMPGNLVEIKSGRLAVHDVEPSHDRRHLHDSLAKHTYTIDCGRLIEASSSSPSIRAHLPPLQHHRVAALKNLNSPIAISEETDSNNRLGAPNVNLATEAAQDDGAALQVNEEAPERDKDGYKRPIDFSKVAGYTWRTNLAKTQPHWPGWFEGLSREMLAAPGAKLLLLAGVDRLDKTLTIGQMQGKFMMKVLPRCGHAVHEDLPEQVASVIGDFMVRNKFAKRL